jgi:two-component system sensor histidine kinase YcbA
VSKNSTSASTYVKIALFDAFMTQIYIDLFSGDFRISVAVLILPVIYYFNRKVNPIIASMYIGIIGLGVRTLIGIGYLGGAANSFFADFNILFFDLSYGLIYYFLLYKKKEYDMTSWLLVVLIADLVSNVIELLTRTGLFRMIEFSDQIYILFYVAIFRTIIAILIVIIIRSYNMFILKTEHNKRYQHLLLRISDLESELYFINRNMEHIEDVMYDSYDLYDGIEEYNRDEIKKKSLDIAKDIHEIKKNYINIYTGIKEITDKDKDDKILKIMDLTSILFKNLGKECEKDNIQLKYQLNSNYYVNESYYFLTIVRNIVINGIEALKNYPSKNRAITLYETSSNGFYVYRIIDNGPGIEGKSINEVFDAGFSTKFENESGDANRGLGLYIVKELVETVFGGQIEVKSIINQSTEFVITIPKERIEVSDEILHSR